MTLARFCSICRLEKRRVEPRDDLALLDDVELKSAFSSQHVPETWVPTCTVVTASQCAGGADGFDDIAAA